MAARAERPDAPMRQPLTWQEEAFYDETLLDQEMRRVFEVCHGCRRCFNLCNSFPRLFDLIDASPSGEVEDVLSADFKSVVDACTLCDLCFVSTCPYVPPHDFNLDFPHLMLRYRAVANQTDSRSMAQTPAAKTGLSRTDRNGRIGTAVSRLANWGLSRKNELIRPLLETVAGIHREAALPSFEAEPWVRRAQRSGPFVDVTAPGYGRKAVLYATCYGNYHDAEIGTALRAVLARNGVETEVVYPGCCGMPQLEHGDLPAVAEAACVVAEGLSEWIDRGYDVIALVPSCALMMKFEWPLLVPANWSERSLVGKLALASFDVSEYIVDLAEKDGLADGLQPLDGSVFLHIACHARAQNMGRKAAEMLRLVPKAELAVMDGCCGHGGTWGMRKENFETAMAVGQPVTRRAVQEGRPYLVSECPLAAMHIAQGMERIGGEEQRPRRALHPIQLMAMAYGLA